MRPATKRQTKLRSSPPRWRGCWWTVLALGTLLVVGAQWWLPALGTWLEQPTRIAKVDAVVILGGGQERQLHGIELYHQAVAPELWQTGVMPDQAASVRDFLANQDIPSEAIEVLPSTNTWEDGQIISTLVRQRGVQSILVVTDWSHGRRALCVIQHHLRETGVAVYYDSPPAADGGAATWWIHQGSRSAVLSELAKIAYYVSHYNLSPWHC